MGAQNRGDFGGDFLPALEESLRRPDEVRFVNREEDVRVVALREGGGRANDLTAQIGERNGAINELWVR